MRDVVKRHGLEPCLQWIGWIGIATLLAAGAGCAQSASSTWAQRSPTMSPEYPAAQAIELGAQRDPHAEQPEGDVASDDGA